MGLASLLANVPDDVSMSDFRDIRCRRECLKVAESRVLRRSIGGVALASVVQDLRYQAPSNKPERVAT